MRWSSNLLKNARRRKTRLAVEELESRVTPYGLSGDVWASPQLLTLSFVPDGTILGSNGSHYLTSNLFATFNAKFGSTAKWQNEILRAAQTWAASTNVNFAIVADDGSSIGSGPDQQGDPNKGDIRIGGYNFGNNWLAQAEMPPNGNNYSVAGDIQFNTGASFNIGLTYDLYTVALHEFGHSLGLDESGVSSAAMYSAYTSTKYGLNSDDVNGIKAIYGARHPGAYDAGSGDNSFATAANLTSQINPSSQTALVTGLDQTTTSEQNYYTFTAPQGTSGNLTVTVQSKGLSLLTPKAWVYAADQSTVLGYASGSNQYGSTLTITLNNVQAGQQYYVKVTGADGSAFSTGAYALTLNFGTGPSPTATPPNTMKPNGNPLSGGGGLAQTNGGLVPWLFALLFSLVDVDPMVAPDAAPAPGPAGGGKPAAGRPESSTPAAALKGEGATPPSASRLLSAAASAVLAPVVNLPAGPGRVPAPSAGAVLPLPGLFPAAVAVPASQLPAPAGQSGGGALAAVPEEELLPTTEVPAAPVSPVGAPAEDAGAGSAADQQESVLAGQETEAPGVTGAALSEDGGEGAVLTGRTAATMPAVAALLAVLGPWAAVPLDQAFSRRRPGEPGAPEGR
jgi:hypothetical protein